MRYLELKHEKLYQQYSSLSREITDVLQILKEPKSLNKSIWKLISKEGIWRLAISKQYGGDGLSWQDFAIALDGFFSNYSDVKFLGLLLSQISVIYLISQYASETIKQRYLPRLIKGDKAFLSISKCINELLNYNSWVNKNNNQNCYRVNNKILIHIKRSGKNIIFYIGEKRSAEKSISINQMNGAILITKDKLVSEKLGLSALYDLINFETLLYGILAASLIEKLNIKTINNSLRI